MNGYSGFSPASYLQLVGAMRGFPDARSLGALRVRGAGYALIHGELLEPEAYRRLLEEVDACRCGLTLLARRPWQNREISLYKIGPAPSSASLAAIRARVSCSQATGSSPHVPVVGIIRPTAQSRIARKNRRSTSTTRLMASTSAAPSPG